MTRADDVAAAVLAASPDGPMTTMKLQKLVYYAQSWSLARTGQPLFDERVEAWTNGPVVRHLWETHRSRRQVSEWVAGDADCLTAAQRSIVNWVVATYGPHSADELIEMTHSQRPWEAARIGLGPDERSTAEITQDAMAEFYSNLAATPDAAAEFAEASVRLEGGVLSDRVQAALAATASGEKSADEVIAARIAQAAG